jgi:hypothetical protein
MVEPISNNTAACIEMFGNSARAAASPKRYYLAVNGALRPARVCDEEVADHTG